MSTVKTTNIQHPSASDVGITLGSDGSVVLPQGFTGGIGSNVVNALRTTSFSTSSTTYVDWTDVVVTITPTSATSKILVICNALEITLAGTTQARYPYLKIERNGTLLDPEAAVRNVGDFNATDLSLHLLDAPATTSPVTYQAQVKMNVTTGTLTYNRGVITAIEVAA